MTTLPSPESFLAEQMGLIPKSVEPKVAPNGAIMGPAQGVPGGSQNQAPSNEFRSLIVNYCAQYIEAYELSQVRWAPLAKRLGTQMVYLEEAAESLDEDGSLWKEVIALRVKLANSSRLFRDNSWEQLEGMALNKLLTMMEKNLIRDPGELLAVARVARTANVSPQQSGASQTVNINLNNGDGSVDGNGLPAAGTRMTIDLSPRLAESLASRQRQIQSVGNRVIDGEMISAKELRTVADGSGEDEGEGE